jgi:hypothetical protein
MCICLFQVEALVLIIGDSHGRHMAAHQHLISQGLKHIGVEFISEGGAQLHFAEEKTHQARGYGILVVMTGGNELIEATTTASYSILG